MSDHVYLAWQDPNSRAWHVIGKLWCSSEGYKFSYTLGVKNIPTFSALPSMQELNKVYSSPELFSLFKNRVMHKNRPEYPDYIRWLGIKHVDDVDELQTLAISGGERETDFFRIIPVPSKNNVGEYAFKFFVNGLSHMTEETRQRATTLNDGEALYLMKDFQNNKDQLALVLRTEDPPSLIGYIPSYMTKLIHKITDLNGNNAIAVKVAQVNKDAPVQMRVLCELSSSFFEQSWEKYEDEFRLIANI